VEAYSYDKDPESPLPRRDIGCRQQCPGRRGATCNSLSSTVAELYGPVQWLSACEPTVLGLVGRSPGAFAATPRARGLPHSPVDNKPNDQAFVALVHAPRLCHHWSFNRGSSEREKILL